MVEPSEASKKRLEQRRASPVERLHQAIADEDPQSLAEALRDGADPEDPGPEYQTPLESAVACGDGHLVTMLLDAGVDPTNTYDPILPQAAGGPREMIESLIAAGASLDGLYNGESALRKAADGGDLSLVELLLAAGADPQAGFSPLLAAAEEGHREIVERLLPYEDDSKVAARAQARLAKALRVAGYSGHHPRAPELFEAIASDDVDEVRGWLASGLPANALRVDRSEGPISALRAASLNGRDDIARLLLEAGAPIDGVQDDEGPLEASTPLIDAIRSGSLDLAERLVAAGAAVDARRDAGAEGRITPLLHLVGSSIPMNPDGTFPIPEILELVRCLARAGADLGAADASGHSALIWAARRGDPRLVEALLDLGADPEQRDSEDNTARTHATYQYSSLGYPPLKLKYFRRPERPTQSDFHAILEMLRQFRPHRCLEAELIAAALHGDARTVRRNLERGAAVDHDLGSGRALDLALQQSHKPVIQALVAAGAEVTERQQLRIEALLSSD